MRSRERRLRLGLLASVWFLAALPTAAQVPAVRLDDRAADRAFVIVIGPVDLPAGAVDPAEAAHVMHGAHAAHGPVRPPIGTVQIPFDVYLHGFRYELVDAAGRRLPTELLHHLNLILPHRRELFLPISRRLLAMGKETGAQSVPPENAGVPISEGEQVTVVAMLHNPTSRSRRGVEVRVYLQYVKAAEQRPTYVVHPFQMDIGFPAGDKDVDLPPGRSTFSWEGSPAVAGKILVIGGHLHEHAVGLTLEDVTAGSVLWEGFPRYDSTGRLVGVTVDIFDDESAIRLDPTHVYRVSATYENPTGDTLHKGGMGVLGGVFQPNVDRPWPAADRTNKLYRLDRMHYLRQVSGRYDEIARGIGASESGPSPHRH